jgi:hypothetical protein
MRRWSGLDGVHCLFVRLSCQVSFGPTTLLVQPWAHPLRFGSTLFGTSVSCMCAVVTCKLSSAFCIFLFILGGVVNLTPGRCFLSLKTNVTSFSPYIHWYSVLARSLDHPVARLKITSDHQHLCLHQKLFPWVSSTCSPISRKEKRQYNW